MEKENGQGGHKKTTHASRKKKKREGRKKVNSGQRYNDHNRRSSLKAQSQRGTTTGDRVLGNKTPAGVKRVLAGTGHQRIGVTKRKPSAQASTEKETCGQNC